METEETITSENALNQENKDASLEASATTEKSPVTEAVSETKTETKQDGETDQQFRSRLGRRVSKMEDEISTFIQEMRATRQAQPIASATQDEEGEYVATENDVRRVISKMESERLTATRNYENQYLDHLARLGTEEGLDDDGFRRLEDLVKTTFNRLSYRDAVTDAERNFSKAMRVIDREKLSKGERHIKLKGDTPIATGVSSGDEMINKEPVMPKLDGHAQNFVNHYKFPEEKVRKWLNE